MANPSKKNTRNDKGRKSANAARPETAKPGAQAAATSPVSAQPPAAAPVQGKAQPPAQGKARPPAQGKTSSQTQTQTENPNRSPSQEQIAKRAYQIFQARGGEHGRHAEDWKQAEQELKLGMQ